MKLNLKNETLMKMSLACLSLVAVAGIALDVLNYIDTEQETARSNHNLQLTQKLADVSDINVLIRNFHGNRKAEAEKMLNWKLEHDLFAINSMATSADAKEKSVARYIVGEIQRDEQAHPDYYLAKARQRCVDAE